MSLRVWYFTSSNFVVIFIGFFLYADDKQSENCDLADSSFVNCLNMRQKCFGAGETMGSISPLMIFSVVFLITLVAITTAVAYRYANLRYHFKPINPGNFSSHWFNFLIDFFYRFWILANAAAGEEEGANEGDVEEETSTWSRWLIVSFTNFLWNFTPEWKLLRNKNLRCALSSAMDTWNISKNLKKVQRV